MILLFLLAPGADLTTPFWPTTGAGWIAFIAALIALGYALYDRIWAKGKRDEELNGFGRRVGKVEDWQKTFDAGATERALIMERISVSQERMLLQIGAAEQSANQCHADTEKLGRELGEKMDRMMEDIRVYERRTTLAAHGLEVELRARGILSAQPPAPPAMPLPLMDRDR